MPNPEYPPKRDPVSLAGIRNRGWVSLRQFCVIADITYPTALRWISLGMINYVQVGGMKRVYEEEIARFMQYGTLKPPEDKLAEYKARRKRYQANAEQKRRDAVRNAFRDPQQR
jgi:hypothetical protein